ncbi:TolC family protein, partial [Bradyrhizobium sp. NBAIM08]|uniref:TolC family protein n=1 Tax=Bradyrhizobium sp. NBAIM08 TaxID=2793815 RepID=UPI001CD6D8C5
TYTGQQDMNRPEKIALELPQPTEFMKVEVDKVLTEAYENRSDAIAFVRRIAEAKKDVARAKGDNGLNATLTARLGYSGSAASVAKAYRSPQDQQLIQLEFDIPILDWGRSRSRTKTAQANQQFTEYAVEQDK